VQSRLVRVWDLGVRSFHWGLVASVTVCAITGFLVGRQALDLHWIAGAVIAALLLFRLIWGVCGAGYAQFRSFPLSVTAIRQHLAQALAGQPERHLGHNPLGAVMVYALMAVLAAIVLTGVVALGGVTKQGPLAFAMPFADGRSVLGIHNLLAYALLGMVAVHLGGVVFESRRSRENLARAMVTGDKQALPGGDAPPRAGRPQAAAMIAAGLAVVLVPGIVLLAHLPGRGVPPATLDAAYVRECGACHMAFPPSLAPAATWNARMDGLDEHFGENASLAPAVAAPIRAWLAANSAEHWDTRAAVTLRLVDPVTPLRITAAPAWLRFHRSIPASVFAAKPAGVKGNCAACHSDAATGRFDPQNIEVPE